MSDLRAVWGLVLTLGRVTMWFAVTVGLGAKALFETARLLTRLRLLYAETLRCPRGHATPAYGVYECTCRSLHEGWVFGRCRVCGLSAGWTPCAVCGLPVRNPLL